MTDDPRFRDITKLIWSEEPLARPSNFFFQGEVVDEQELFICSVLPPKFRKNSLTKTDAVITVTDYDQPRASLFSKPEWCVTIGTSYEQVKKYLFDNGITPLVMVDYKTWKSYLQTIAQQQPVMALSTLGIPELPYVKNKQYLAFVSKKRIVDLDSGKESSQGQEDTATGGEESKAPSQAILISAPTKSVAVLASKKYLSSHQQTGEQASLVVGVVPITDLGRIDEAVSGIISQANVVETRILDSRSGRVSDGLALSFSRRFPNLSPEEIVKNDRKEDDESYVWYEELKQSDDPEDQWRAEKYKGLFRPIPDWFKDEDDRKFAKRIAIIRKLDLENTSSLYEKR